MFDYQQVLALFKPVLEPVQEGVIIVDAIRSRDPDAAIDLHGSRTDDDARGGDIDLLVLSAAIDLIAKLDILGEIHAGIGDRRVDLIVTPEPSDPFSRIAAGGGVLL